MDYLPYIESMYSQICEYRGDFGDPIDWGPFNPVEVLGGDQLTTDEISGLSIALLSLLTTACDNATLQAAQLEYSDTIHKLLENGHVSDKKPIVNALQTFTTARTEQEFTVALGLVYSEIIRGQDDGKSADA